VTGGRACIQGYEILGERAYKEVDLEKLARDVLLYLIREKLEDYGIEEFINWRKGKIEVSIELDYFADMLKYEYERITKR